MDFMFISLFFDHDCFMWPIYKVIKKYKHENKINCKKMLLRADVSLDGGL